MKEQIEKQAIEEMACDMCTVILNCNEPCKPIPSCHAYQHAKRAYEKGYRKQIVGEWEEMGQDYVNCSVCGTIFEALPTLYAFKRNNIYCRHCGAKMKGGAE